MRDSTKATTTHTTSDPKCSAPADDTSTGMPETGDRTNPAHASEQQTRIRNPLLPTIPSGGAATAPLRNLTSTSHNAPLGAVTAPSGVRSVGDSTFDISSALSVSEKALQRAAEALSMRAARQPPVSVDTKAVTASVTREPVRAAGAAEATAMAPTRANEGKRTATQATRRVQRHGAQVADNPTKHTGGDGGPKVITTRPTHDNKNLLVRAAGETRDDPMHLHPIAVEMRLKDDLAELGVRNEELRNLTARLRGGRGDTSEEEDEEEDENDEVSPSEEGDESTGPLPNAVAAWKWKPIDVDTHSPQEDSGMWAITFIHQRLGPVNHLPEHQTARQYFDSLKSACGGPGPEAPTFSQMAAVMRTRDITLLLLDTDNYQVKVAAEPSPSPQTWKERTYYLLTRMGGHYRPVLTSTNVRTEPKKCLPLRDLQMMRWVNEWGLGFEVQPPWRGHEVGTVDEPDDSQSGCQLETTNTAAQSGAVGEAPAADATIDGPSAVGDGEQGGDVAPADAVTDGDVILTDAATDGDVALADTTYGDDALADAVAGGDAPSADAAGGGVEMADARVNTMETSTQPGAEVNGLESLREAIKHCTSLQERRRLIGEHARHAPMTDELFQLWSEARETLESQVQANVNAGAHDHSEAATEMEVDVQPRAALAPDEEPVDMEEADQHTRTDATNRRLENLIYNFQVDERDAMEAALELGGRHRRKPLPSNQKLPTLDEPPDSTRQAAVRFLDHMFDGYVHPQLSEQLAEAVLVRATTHDEQQQADSAAAWLGRWHSHQFSLSVKRATRWLVDGPGPNAAQPDAPPTSAERIVTDITNRVPQMTLGHARLAAALVDFTMITLAKRVNDPMLPGKMYETSRVTMAFHIVQATAVYGTFFQPAQANTDTVAQGLSWLSAGSGEGEDTTVDDAEPIDAGHAQESSLDTTDPRAVWISIRWNEKSSTEKREHLWDRSHPRLVVGVNKIYPFLRRGKVKTYETYLGIAATALAVILQPRIDSSENDEGLVPHYEYAHRLQNAAVITLCAHLEPVFRMHSAKYARNDDMADLYAATRGMALPSDSDMNCQAFTADLHRAFLAASDAIDSDNGRLRLSQMAIQHGARVEHRTAVGLYKELREDEERQPTTPLMRGTVRHFSAMALEGSSGGISGHLTELSVGLIADCWAQQANLTQKSVGMDVGCGPGSFLLMVRELYPWLPLEGFDLDGRSAKMAIQNMGQLTAVLSHDVRTIGLHTVYPGDLMLRSSLHPATHVYCHAVGFPPPELTKLLRLVATTDTLLSAVIVYGYAADTTDDQNPFYHLRTQLLNNQHPVNEFCDDRGRSLITSSRERFRAIGIGLERMTGNRRTQSTRQLILQVCDQYGGAASECVHTNLRAALREDKEGQHPVRLESTAPSLSGQLARAPFRILAIPVPQGSAVPWSRLSLATVVYCTRDRAPMFRGMLMAVRNRVPKEQRSADPPDFEQMATDAGVNIYVINTVTSRADEYLTSLKLAGQEPLNVLVVRRSSTNFAGYHAVAIPSSITGSQPGWRPEPLNEDQLKDFLRHYGLDRTQGHSVTSDSRTAPVRPREPRMSHEGGETHDVGEVESSGDEDERVPLSRRKSRRVADLSTNESNLDGPSSPRNVDKVAYSMLTGTKALKQPVLSNPDDLKTLMASSIMTADLRGVTFDVPTEEMPYLQLVECAPPSWHSYPGLRLFHIRNAEPLFKLLNERLRGKTFHELDGFGDEFRTENVRENQLRRLLSVGSTGVVKKTIEALVRAVVANLGIHTVIAKSTIISAEGCHPQKWHRDRTTWASVSSQVTSDEFWRMISFKCEDESALTFPIPPECLFLWPSPYCHAGERHLQGPWARVEPYVMLDQVKVVSQGTFTYASNEKEPLTLWACTPNDDDHVLECRDENVALVLAAVPNVTMTSPYTETPHFRLREETGEADVTIFPGKLCFIGLDLDHMNALDGCTRPDAMIWTNGLSWAEALRPLNPSLTRPVVLSLTVQVDSPASSEAGLVHLVTRESPILKVCTASEQDFYPQPLWIRTGPSALIAGVEPPPQDRTLAVCGIPVPHNKTLVYHTGDTLHVKYLGTPIPMVRARGGFVYARNPLPSRLKGGRIRLRGGADGSGGESSSESEDSIEEVPDRDLTGADSAVAHPKTPGSRPPPASVTRSRPGRQVRPPGPAVRRDATAAAEAKAAADAWAAADDQAAKEAAEAKALANAWAATEDQAAKAAAEAKAAVEARAKATAKAARAAADLKVATEARKAAEAKALADAKAAADDLLAADAATRASEGSRPPTSPSTGGPLPAVASDPAVAEAIVTSLTQLHSVVRQLELSTAASTAALKAGMENAAKEHAAALRCLEMSTASADDVLGLAQRTENTEKALIQLKEHLDRQLDDARQKTEADANARAVEAERRLYDHLSQELKARDDHLSQKLNTRDTAHEQSFMKVQESYEKIAASMAKNNAETDAVVRASMHFADLPGKGPSASQSTRAGVRFVGTPGYTLKTPGTQDPKQPSAKAGGLPGEPSLPQNLFSAPAIASGEGIGSTGASKSADDPLAPWDVRRDLKNEAEHSTPTPGGKQASGMTRFPTRTTLPEEPSGGERLYACIFVVCDMDSDTPFTITITTQLLQAYLYSSEPTVHTLSSAVFSLPLLPVEAFRMIVHQMTTSYPHTIFHDLTPILNEYGQRQQITSEERSIVGIARVTFFTVDTRVTAAANQLMGILPPMINQFTQSSHLHQLSRRLERTLSAPFQNNDRDLATALRASVLMVPSVPYQRSMATSSNDDDPTRGEQSDYHSSAPRDYWTMLSKRPGQDVSEYFASKIPLTNPETNQPFAMLDIHFHFLRELKGIPTKGLLSDLCQLRDTFMVVMQAAYQLTSRLPYIGDVLGQMDTRTHMNLLLSSEAARSAHLFLEVQKNPGDELRQVRALQAIQNGLATIRAGAGSTQSPVGGGTRMATIAAEGHRLLQSIKDIEASKGPTYVLRMCRSIWARWTYLWGAENTTLNFDHFAMLLKVIIDKLPSTDRAASFTWWDQNIREVLQKIRDQPDDLPRSFRENIVNTLVQNQNARTQRERPLWGELLALDADMASSAAEHAQRLNPPSDSILSMKIHECFIQSTEDLHFVAKTGLLLTHFMPYLRAMLNSKHAAVAPLISEHAIFTMGCDTPGDLAMLESTDHDAGINAIAEDDMTDEATMMPITTRTGGAPAAAPSTPKTA